MAGRCVSCLRHALGSRTGAILAVLVLCGMLLSGCGDIGETLADLFRLNGDAEAQNGNGDGGAKLIETFAINPGTFELRPDMMPEIAVFDGATQYTLRSDATIDFEPAPGFDQLEAGDIVIERPEANVVTVIRDQ